VSLPQAPVTRTANNRALVNEEPTVRAAGRAGAGWPALGALAALTAIATWVRLPGLTRLGLYTDDAWAAMSARVGLGTAIRMGVTTPGYSLAERSWIQLRPASVAWAQLPALILGIAAVIAMYALARWYRLPRWLALAAALVVATGPVTVAYSSHVKEYSADFVLACMLLVLAEASRRSRASVRLLGGLTVMSIGAFFISASVATVIAAVWAALLIDGVADPERRRRVLTSGAVAAAACGLIALVLLRDLPPSLHGFWQDRGFFPQTSSAGAVVASLHDAVSSVFGGLGLWRGRVPPGILSDMAVGPARTMVFLVAAGLVVAGLFTGRRTIAPAFVLFASLAAWAVSVVPLGTGRTDVVVYPALLLLIALGVHHLTALVGSWLPVHGPARIGLQAVGGLVLVACAAILVLQPGVRREHYPAVDSRSLAAHISADHRPDDLIMVAPGARFTWGYAEAPAPRIRFGGQWTMGFTVESGDPGTIIAPGCANEPGYDPQGWADAAQGASRVWYVGSSTVCDPAPESDQLYLALIADAFHPVERVDAEAGYVVLLGRA
jgi:hypothetical protein